MCGKRILTCFSGLVLFHTQMLCLWCQLGKIFKMVSYLNGIQKFATWRDFLESNCSMTWVTLTLSSSQNHTSQKRIIILPGLYLKFTFTLFYGCLTCYANNNESGRKRELISIILYKGTWNSPFLDITLLLRDMEIGTDTKTEGSPERTFFFIVRQWVVWIKSSICFYYHF